MKRALWLVCCLATAGLAAVDGGYAVVVSQATANDTAWQPVVAAVVAKYGAETIVWDKSVDAARERLNRSLPRYVAFVARPEESGRPFVVAIHRLMRSLADAPYGTSLWGILTGYEPGDVLRMLKAEPLTIKRGLGGTSIPLELFDSGSWFDEGRKNHRVDKSAPGAAAADVAGPDDPAETIAAMLTTEAPDFFMTSGHATERDWQIGYSYPAGCLRCRDGVLLGIPRSAMKVTRENGAARLTITKAVAIHSPNPKVYLASGNCLMGHLSDKQSMAAAWLHSGGANQLVGYTVVTWFGYMGWGVRDYFLGQAGRFNLAESFFANEQALAHRLATEFPGKAAVDPTEADYQAQGSTLGQLAAKLGYTQQDRHTQDHLGLLWDRDTVAFYGDPAWDARLQPRSSGWEQTLTERDGVWTLTITATKDAGAPGRPPFAFFPRRLKLGGIVAGQEYAPVVTPTFVMVTGLRKLVAGESYKVVVRAQ